MIREFIQSSPPLLAALATGVLVVHVSGGVIGLATGTAALIVGKGTRLHRRVGAVFVVAMTVMAVTGALIAPFLPRAQLMNLAGGLFTLYLVATAWAAVKTTAAARRIELAATLLPIFLIATALAVAVGWPGPMPKSQAMPIYAFAVLSGFALALDARRAAGPAAGRLAVLSRHLWRMCLAVAIAAASFFIGQADVLPQPLRGPHLAVFPLAALAALVLFMVKVRASPAFRALRTPG